MPQDKKKTSGGAWLKQDITNNHKWLYTQRTVNFDNYLNTITRRHKSLTLNHKRTITNYVTLQLSERGRNKLGSYITALHCDAFPDICGFKVGIRQPGPTGGLLLYYGIVKSVQKAYCFHESGFMKA